MKPANRLARHSPASLVLVAVFFIARPASATIKYRVSLAHGDQHTFQVEIEIPDAAAGAEVAMPAWNALYQVRDFAYRVHDLQVGIRSAPGGTQWSIPRPLDKQTWQIEPLSPTPEKRAPTDLLVRYSIDWDDSGPFNSQLNGHHGFINFAEILMYIPDRRSETTEVLFEGTPSGWKIAAELPAGPEPLSFTADSYDALVDAPVEAGTFSEFSFDSVGVHFRVVVDGTDWNRSRLEYYLRRVTTYELQLMRDPAFKEYTFLIHFGPYADVGGGGMEHSNSTAIAATSVDGAAELAAHEFFHAWNVKRIRPQALEPVDYTKEQYTSALWFAEGVTSTYAAYALERSELWTKDQFYADLAAQIGELDARKARTWQSVEQSSLDAWLEKYDDYGAPVHSISYYNKGQIVGVMLDLAIRDSTENHQSLDAVLRRMNDEYAKAGRFYNESDGIRSVVEEITGKDFGEFFRRFVSGTDEIPYSDYLDAAGLELTSETTKVADLGFSPATSFEKGTVVSYIEPGSEAEAAGLRDGDVILGPVGKTVTADPIEWLRALPSGDSVQLRIRRGKREMQLSFRVGTREDRRYSIVEIPHPSEKQRRIRSGILSGVTD